MKLIYLEWYSGLDTVVYAVIALGIIFLVFMVLRELFTWYWKINAIVENQVKQTKLLEKLMNHFEEEKKD
jgi:hypothetical protein